MFAANNKVSPKLEDESSYEKWKKDIEIWCELTNLAVEKRALAIHLVLTGRTRDASSELEITELKAEEGVKTLLNKLD